MNKEITMSFAVLYCHKFSLISTCIGKELLAVWSFLNLLIYFCLQIKSLIFDIDQYYNIECYCVFFLFACGLATSKYVLPSVSDKMSEKLAFKSLTKVFCSSAKQCSSFTAVSLSLSVDSLVLYFFGILHPLICY